ncbi:SPASM domain-containing protein [Candidatus Dependentiae bacterium]|nr:SPASM domain-containing protein [Candidatus Dependentiae bacterium]
MELFNLKTVVNNFAQDECEKDLKRAESYYEKNNEINNLYLNNNLEIIKNPGDYILAKNLGKKYLPGIRVRNYSSPDNFPLRLNIEITNECNSKCKMCSRVKMNRKERHLSFNEFKNIIDQTKGHNLVELYLYRLGEPFLNPGLPQMLEYLKSFNNFEYIWISSNGLELTEKHMDMVLNSNIRMFNMSINAAYQESYSKINDIGKLKTVEDNFRKVIEHKKKSNNRLPFMRSQMLIQDATEEEGKFFIEKWQDYADIINLGIIEFGSTLDFNKEISNKYHTVNIEADCKKPARYSFYLYTNGAVVPCMCDYNAEYLNIGNWRDDSLEKIFKGSKYQSFLSRHFNEKRHEIEFCKDCLDYTF